MFDFSAYMERLVRDIVHHTPDFAHIDCDRLLVGVSQQRKFGSTGLYAKVLPLRFEAGRLNTQEHGAHWAVPPFTYHGREILYLIAFCLPRFLNIAYQHKGETIFHELYHIGPQFDGDLRRFPGKYYQHGPDAKQYDAQMMAMFREYERRTAAPHLIQGLRSRFHHLEDRYGLVTGLFARAPEPVQVAGPEVRLPPVELHVRHRPVMSARTKLQRSA